MLFYAEEVFDKFVKSIVFFVIPHLDPEDPGFRVYMDLLNSHTTRLVHFDF